MMKNSEIHFGLDKKEIRDLLGRLLGEHFSVNERIVTPFNKENPFDGEINNAKSNVKYYQSHLKYLERKKAAYEIMKYLKWEEEDVSDYIEKDLNYYMSFIGTSQEYRELFKKLKQ